MSGESNRQPLLHLRPWQRDALDAFNSSKSNNFLAVATPGAGKTTFALIAARKAMPNLPGRLCIVAPTKHLKQQWAEAAGNFGISVTPNWNPNERMPSDVHGVVTTYQQVGMMPEKFFELSQGGFVILDEVHHAGDEKSWGEGVTNGFAGASKRLCLSGTPFRSDTNKIPYVHYEHDTAVADYEYDYATALKETVVVRPVFFPRFGGTMEWTSSDGLDQAASFADPLDRSGASQRLRAALSLEGEWLPTVLGEANEQLAKIRKVHKSAAGLVIAMDQDHARGIVKIMRERFGVAAELAISEDSEASRTISRFRGSEKPWLVAVRMVSEGVDIPRLTVGVYATTTSTELFFRQAVGRIVRYVPGAGPQKSFMFIPDDFRLRHYASEIAESRRHSLKKRDSGDTERVTTPADEQLSLFQVHSATATEAPANSDLLSALDDHEAEAVTQVEESEVDPSLLIDLAALPTIDGGAQPNLAVTIGGSNDAQTQTQGHGHVERERMRRINQDLAAELAKVTKFGHAKINIELNRRAGITAIGEATLIQLNRRSREAEKWLRQEQRRINFVARTQ